MAIEDAFILMHVKKVGTFVINLNSMSLRKHSGYKIVLLNVNIFSSWEEEQRMLEKEKKKRYSNIQYNRC